jgi:hypothetical protein
MSTRCSRCKDEDDLFVCTSCGRNEVSVLDATVDPMDSMVQAASIPNLATLFKRAKDAGLTVSGTDYGGS